MTITSICGLASFVCAFIERGSEHYMSLALFGLDCFGVFCLAAIAFYMLITAE